MVINCKQSLKLKFAKIMSERLVKGNISKKKYEKKMSLIREVKEIQNGK